MDIHPIYSQFFPNHGVGPSDWAPFKNYRAVGGSVDLDFSIYTEKTWKETAQAIGLLILKIMLFPWGLYELAKALIERIVMLVVCPAQLVFSFEENLRMRRQIETDLTNRQDVVGREIILGKEGHLYNGLLFGSRETLSNGKWALFACGNGTSLEKNYLSGDLAPYLEAGYNALLVNGPGVGKSEGLATVDRIADAQEVALSFLETAVKAKRIVLAGHSLGGAAIGLAALKHTFKPEINYLAIRMMTFDRLSQIAKKLQGWIPEKIIRWFECEIDSVAASKKFQDEGIHEIVLQGGQDEIMAQSSLLDALQREGLMENKTGLVLPDADHCHFSLDAVQEQIERWDHSLDLAQADGL